MSTYEFDNQRIYNDLEALFQKALEQDALSTALRVKEAQMKIIFQKGREFRSQGEKDHSFSVNDLKKNDLKKILSEIDQEIQRWREGKIDKAIV